MLFNFPVLKLSGCKSSPLIFGYVEGGRVILRMIYASSLNVLDKLFFDKLRASLLNLVKRCEAAANKLIFLVYIDRLFSFWLLGHFTRTLL